MFAPCRFFESRDPFLLIERDRKKNGLHRIIVRLISRRLRVPAHAKKQPVEMRLVFAPQRTPEFRPAFDCVLNQLNECRNSAAHEDFPLRRWLRKPKCGSLADECEAAAAFNKLRNAICLCYELRKKCSPGRLKRCGIGEDG